MKMELWLWGSHFANVMCYDCCGQQTTELWVLSTTSRPLCALRELTSFLFINHLTRPRQSSVTGSLLSLCEAGELCGVTNSPESAVPPPRNQFWPRISLLPLVHVDPSGRLDTSGSEIDNMLASALDWKSRTSSWASLASGPSFDLVVSFPILLGTIPLQEAIPGLSTAYDTQFGGGFTLPPPPDQFK